MIRDGEAVGCGDELSADDLLQFAERLAAVGGAGTAADDVEVIDRIAALERAKHAITAAQARLAVRLDESRRRQQVRDGVPPARLGRGVADQVALARGESPHRGQRHLGLARALVHEMPCTMAALTRGDVSEWGATVVARETATLSVEHRREVDARLAPVLASSGVSERQLGEAARRHAYELDAAAAVRRASMAEGDRCVTIRPAPDTMTYLTALLPVGAGVGAYAELDAAARSAAAAGDPRSRGQVMADTLVARLVGGAEAGAAPAEGPEQGETARAETAQDRTAQDRTTQDETAQNETVPGMPAPDEQVTAARRCTRPPVAGVTVHVVMSEASLFGAGDEPAEVLGHGPVPAAVARDLLAQAAANDRAWLRRLWTRPSDGELVGLDSRSRRFPAGLARLIRLRDRVCSTPWCDAPIRHADHVRAWADGGETTLANGEGLCEHCNLVKEDSGSTTLRVGCRTAVTTVTGHVYVGDAPPALGQAPPQHPLTTERADAAGTAVPAGETAGETSRLEQLMRTLVGAAA